MGDNKSVCINRDYNAVLNMEKLLKTMIETKKDQKNTVQKKRKSQKNSQKQEREKRSNGIKRFKIQN